MKTESISAFEAVFGKDYERSESIKDKGYAIVEPELVIFDRNALKVAPRKLYRFDRFRAFVIFAKYSLKSTN
jgi:predicted fused transcriptional regulator/phosphomethylpyrimidine kinase